MSKHIQHMIIQSKITTDSSRSPSCNLKGQLDLVKKKKVLFNSVSVFSSELKEAFGLNVFKTAKSVQLPQLNLQVLQVLQVKNKNKKKVLRCPERLRTFTDNTARPISIWDIRV